MARTHQEFNVVKMNLPVRSVGEEAAALTGKLRVVMAGELPTHRQAGIDMQTDGVKGSLHGFIHRDTGKLRKPLLAETNYADG